MQTITTNSQHSIVSPRPKASGTITLALASVSQREAIYRLRHRVYAEELGQHAMNPDQSLRDPLDDRNIYLVALEGNALLGFVSLTPPAGASYSIDKYFTRSALPVTMDATTWEVRLLTVLAEHRGRDLAILLMYAALRWVEAQAGQTVMAIGREEILPLYVRAGLNRTGLWAASGQVRYEFVHATVAELNANLPKFQAMLERAESNLHWSLPMPFLKPAACFHGGAFFDAIGDTFEHLERREEIINADVLDAWFDPAPEAIQALAKHLPWLAKTSPPTDCGGLRQTIATVRGVPVGAILVGAGSSDLMFRVLPQWLRRDSRVLLLDPTYGEYAHLLEKVIRCRVDRLLLQRENNYTVPLASLREHFRKGYDLIILVNPNSPTGQHLAHHDLLPLFSELAPQTKLWVDETYTDYVGPEQSVETAAAASHQVVVCKSLSKVYGLSGLRAAYLCGPPMLLEPLQAITPPWVVSLPAQVAAVYALQDPDYYAARYSETRSLREQFKTALEDMGLTVIPGCANFLLCHLSEDQPTAAAVVQACRQAGVFLRDASVLGPSLGERALRIAVKPLPEQARIIASLRAALG
jgi:histidinol-phosphate/aromatic aminotransferase/cobyric acid decarboxylase-like protein/GNAT superfamily N-acetyltransferase